MRESRRSPVFVRFHTTKLCSVYISYAISFAVEHFLETFLDYFTNFLYPLMQVSEYLFIFSASWALSWPWGAL